ncbi:hypothetical protein [Mucilaginibacter panaciglaebae]|uniref:hypothetical protein n=1 Tax=Mucilaginibacter panaciglaebae TaxID=502331 RepID=UPI0031EC1A64
MKTLKLTIAALLLAFTFQAANAQVRVGVRIGTPPPPPRRVVVVHPPVHRTVIVRHRPVIVTRRPVVVAHRSYYRSHYYRPHRTVVVRRHY